MKLEISNFLGGISPSDRIGQEGSYYIGAQADPTISGDLGYLRPGYTPTIIATSGGGVLGGLIHSFVKDYDNFYLYGIEAQYGEGKLHQLDTGLNLISNATYPHQINTTSTSIGEDVEIYSCNTTASEVEDYLFYSWRNATDGDVGRVRIKETTTTFDDDFLSDSAQSGAKLLKTVPHPMMEWQENGYLYIGNGQCLVSLDGKTGSNGTMDATALTLPAGWVITSLFNAEEYIGITAVADVSRRSAVFFWDGTSDQWNRKVMVPLIYIYASHTLNGEFYIIGTHPELSGVIMQWDGTRFKLVSRIIDNVSTVNAVSPFTYGGITQYRNCLLFNAGYNKTYKYGSGGIGIPKALFNILKTTISTNVTMGAIFVDGGTIVTAYQDATPSPNAYYLIKANSGNNVDFAWKSLYYEFPQKVRLNYIKLYHQTITANDDDIKITTDYGKATTTVGTVTTGNTTKISCRTVPTCNNFRIEIDSDTVSGVKYGKLVVDYSLVPDNE